MPELSVQVGRTIRSFVAYHCICLFFMPHSCTFLFLSFRSPCDRSYKLTLFIRCCANLLNGNNICYLFARSHYTVALLYKMSFSFQSSESQTHSSTPKISITNKQLQWINLVDCFSREVLILWHRSPGVHTKILSWPVLSFIMIFINVLATLSNVHFI